MAHDIICRMELLIVRHGPAGDKDEWRKTGRPDAERPLTAEGRRKTAAAARGLRGLAGADLVLTSPWKRAQQTAALVAAELDAPMEVTEALLPDREFEELARALRGAKKKSVAVVGHEPHLSGFATWLLIGGEGRPVLALKKGQAALLDTDGTAGSATLLWSVAPKGLRGLAG
jgi:phosphohistidine phosphatase